MRLPNGYGSITKLSGNRRRPYMVRMTTGFTDDGKQKMKVLGYYATRKEALAALTDFNNAPYDLSAPSLTFAKAYESWAKHTYEDGTPPRCYSSVYRYCAPILDMPFKEIKTAAFQKLINDCDKGYSTKKNLKILFNLITKYCVANDLAVKNYAALTKLPPKVESRLHAPFTPQELDTLWQNAASDARIQSVLILCYTGMRPTEMLKIRKENIDFGKPFMRGGSKTAAGKNRVIPIADKILPFVKAACERSKGDFLFSGEDGGALDYDHYRRRYWEPVMNMFRMSHLPHDGRHTCQTMLNNADVNEKICKLILGHASTSVTERVYTHKTVEQLVEAINRI